MRTNIVHGVRLDRGGFYNGTHINHIKNVRGKKLIKYYQRLIEALRIPILLSQSQNVNDSH
jgi:hypothetical protein